MTDMINNSQTLPQSRIVNALAEDILALSEEELLSEIEEDHGNLENFIVSFFGGDGSTGTEFDVSISGELLLECTLANLAAIPVQGGKSLDSGASASLVGFTADMSNHGVVVADHPAAPWFSGEINLLVRNEGTAKSFVRFATTPRKSTLSSGRISVTLHTPDGGFIAKADLSVEAPIVSTEVAADYSTVLDWRLVVSTE